MCSQWIIGVTGATGYVGGRLLDALQARGERARALVRRPEVLRTRVAPETEVVLCDLDRPETLAPALAGLHTVYYLVHALAASGDLERREEAAAEHFARAARLAGVRRIIYLGGLCSGSGSESAHMRSRLRVGHVLRHSGVPTLELRASVIIGSGSLSFEMVRSLVHRLPIMTTPRWVTMKAQPIAIGDVIAYLLAALDHECVESRVFEIGGAEEVSYADLMKEYARQVGLRRIIIPVPVLTPGLSSLWLNLVTPLFARVGRRLIESISAPSVVRDTSALRAFPVRPVGVRTAIEQALRNEDREFAQTHWTDAVSSAMPPQWGGVVLGSRIVDVRTADVPVPPEKAFAPVRRIGGKTGWYYGNSLWRLRGFADRLLGGVGMNRSRRDPEALRLGDVVDCWRVEQYDPPHMLRLAAEMKLPGRAWLQFEVTRLEQGSRICQSAVFDPHGLGGLVYWYALYPVHQLVFAGMLRGMVRAAQDDSQTPD